MKKHQLLEKAMKDYPSETKIYSTSGNMTSHETKPPYFIDEYGSVQDNYGWLIYYKSQDKWAEIVTEKQSILSDKCAIQVNNEREYKLLIEHYKAKGFKWTANVGSLKMTDLNRIELPRAILYDDRCTHGILGSYEKEITFQDFAKEVGIEVPMFVMKSEDEVDLYVGDEYYFVHKYDKKNWQLGDSFSKITMNSASFLSPGNSKAFSTKQAAEKWCYYHNKPKEIKLEFEGWECIVTKDKICVHLDVENGKGYYMNGGEIEPIYEAYKSLQ